MLEPIESSQTKETAKCYGQVIILCPKTGGNKIVTFYGLVTNRDAEGTCPDCNAVLTFDLCAMGDKDTWNKIDHGSNHRRSQVDAVWHRKVV